MNIQMVDLHRQYEKYKPEIDKAVLAVIDSGQFINGPDVKRFADEMQQYLGVKYAIPCANGTDALLIALMALGIKPGDEVITTPFTFVATAETIAILGARPVYVDIDPKTYNIDPDLIEAAITPKTKAIVPVHLYGQAADMDSIMDIAERHNLSVIEDAAQAVGEKYKGKRVCSIGDIGCISFFPSKNLGAYGDAGMVVTSKPEIAENLQMIANHGSHVRYRHEVLGVNSRLDSIQAAILRVKLRHLDEWNKKRREIAAYYSNSLRNDEIVTPYIAPYAEHIFHQYTLQVKERDALQKYLKDKNIPNAIHYPIPLHQQPAFKTVSGHQGSLENSEAVSARVISLPMHPDLTTEEQDYIIQSILEFVNS